MSLVQDSLITVTVDGGSLGVFDTRSGGEVTGVVVKRRSGGQGPIKQSGGLPDYGDVTVTREYEPARDHELYRTLARRAGKAEMSVSHAIYDDNGQLFKRPIVFLGKILNVTAPDADSTGADNAMLTLTMSVRSIA